MSKHEHHRTSVSALMGITIVNSDGGAVGRVAELAVAPAMDTAHVHGLILKHARGAEAEMVHVSQLEVTDAGTLQLRQGRAASALLDAESYLMLERDVLDQQIIDIHGHKVVRVNDVDLVWGRDTDGALSLKITEVEVGLRGALRRLLKGLPAVSVERIACRFKPGIIPWDFVDLIERDPARRVRLKIQQDRLSQMHPSDLADILEELAPAERQALFISLDEEVAAEALEEVGPKMQQSLLESMDSEQAAGIVEEMDPAAAADLLAELPDERSEAILGEMDPEERQEVEELLEFSGDSAAGRMTTDYIALHHDALMADAIKALREFEGDSENVTEIYLLDAEEKLTRLIPLVQLLLAGPETPLNKLPDSHIVSCHVDAKGAKVAELFDKYNLRSLPVLDDAKRLVGVIHAEQVIALLRAKR